jgi:tRNA (cytidine/uridine-2'-O-)-methyltransferase
MDVSIVLFSPEIPGNTGSIGRTCLALGIELILIHPLGFDLSEKSVRRAGLDYWKHIKISEFKNWQEFISDRKPQTDQLFYFTRHASKSYFDVSYKPGSYLIFGPESTGLPIEMLNENEDQSVKLPIVSDKVRSLNLASVVTAAAYECFRQIVDCR